MRKIKLENYKEKIKAMYWDKKLSLKKTAKEIGVSAGLIRKNMVSWNIKRRASRKRELKKPNKKEIERLYLNNNLGIEGIRKSLDVGLTTFYRWLKEENIKPSRRFKYQKLNFSGDPKEKAYILGLVNGDIHARKHYRQILAELTTTHPTMMDLFFSVFEKYGTPKKYSKYNKITGRYEWKVYVLLNNSFEFMLTKDLDMDNEYFYNFLAGFFDCEGCLYVYNNHSYVGLRLLVYNCNKKLLEIIKRRLGKDRFDAKLNQFFKQGQKTTNNYYRGKDLWAVTLDTNKEVLSLMNRIPIKHKEKIDKLKIANSSINKRWSEISNQVVNLKSSIKQEVNEFIRPKGPNQNERNIVL